MGPYVKKLRALHGWTQDELAKRAGMEQNTLSSIERGRTQLPSQPVLFGLADALDTSEVDLLIHAGYIRADRLPAEFASRHDAATRLFSEVYAGLSEPARDALLAQLDGLRRARLGGEEQ